MSAPSPSSEAASPTRRTGLRPLERWFKAVHVPREAPRELTDLARRGSVVFVMRSAGVLNFLFLAWLMRRLRLPPLRAALGLTGAVPWLLRVRGRPAALEEALARGESSVVFLRRAAGPDPFPLLTALQRKADRPVLLVPALLVWTRRPQKLKRTLGDILFGTPDQPSRFANAVGFLLNYRRAVLRLGRPTDLAAFVGERPGEPDAVLARKTRGAIHFHLAREVRAVVGPHLKTAGRVREQVLRDRGLRAALEREARSTGRPLPAVQAEAERDLREIASRYSPGFVELVRPVLSWIFRRLYDAVDVDEEGLARVKRAAGEAPIVLCPSHKSYIDFLVLSWVFSQQGMTPPHIAAGINLAFWPFGAIARHGGAFFIRRTIKGDRIYAATLRAYVKGLLRDRFPQEFYLEGGRSRSGKLLFPKTGLFSMQVDAWLEGAAPDVLFVPVAIDYEHLLEGSAYARELAGGEKKKEDLQGLLRARKVLRRRYGRLVLQFEEPVSLRLLAAERLEGGARTPGHDDERPAPAAGDPAPSDEQRRILVQALANRVAYGINRASTVTPVGLVAVALLSSLKRGLPAAEVTQRIELLRAVAADEGARFAEGLAGAPSDPRQPGPLAAAVARLVDDGLVRVERAAGETILQPVEDRRPQLDYHKNAVIHRYVPLALVAAALRGAGGASTAEVKERTRSLSRLFKLEFMYRAGVAFDAIFAETVSYLARLGLLREADGRLLPPPDGGGLEFLAQILRPYLEAYRAAAEALLAAGTARPDEPLDRKSIVKAALERGRADYAAGRIALRESLSKAVFENAAEWFFTQGAIEADGESGRLGASWRDTTLPLLVRELDALLRA